MITVDKKYLAILFVASIVLNWSCQNNPKYSKAEILSYQIAHESCQEMGVLSASIVNGVVSGLTNFITDGLLSNVDTGNLGNVPEYWCECFKYYAVMDLSTKFTEDELFTIRDDRIKKFMVLGKVIESRHEQIKNCIASETQGIAEDYISFSKNLDSKFK